MEKTSVEMIRNGIVVFTIQRPEVRNAIDYDVMEDLAKVIKDVRNNSSCKALVITGSKEQAFCSGGDLSVFQELHTKAEAYSMLSKMGEILYELLILNRPTFALLNGIAIGGGCELATACDFRLARYGVNFGFVQGKLGITTGWGGGSILQEKLPFDKAFHLLYSAGTFSVSLGEEIGFIHSIFKELNWKEEAMNRILQIVSGSSPAVLASYKEIAARRWQDMNMRNMMLAEIEQCSILWESKEHHVAISDFLARKKK